MTSKIRMATIPAWYAKDLMDRDSEPEEWVVWCEVFDSGKWRKFVDNDDIDNHVDTWIELSDLAEDMVRYNIGFMPSFKLNRVGGGFSGVDPIQIDPMFHAVMSSNYATLNELRTVYSMEDVFLMLDSITTAKRNEKLAIDAAKAEAGNGR